MLQVLCLILLVSTASTSQLFQFNHGQRGTCATSSNTQTLILKDLKHFRVGAEYFRAGSEGLVALLTAQKRAHISKKNNEANKITDPFTLALEELFTHVWERSNYLVEEVLSDLYGKYPCIEHVNHVYRDSQNISASSILHLAVKTNNTDLVNFLRNNYDGLIEYNIRDSDGLTPAELAYEEGSQTMLKQLITAFPSILLEPFHKEISLIHFAARYNFDDLISFVAKHKLYDFNILFHSSLHILSPLEIALLEDNFDVAELLFEFNAPYRTEILQYIFTRFMNILHIDGMPAYYMVTHFTEELLYFKNQEGFDLMQLAINLNFNFLVEVLIEIGYQGVESLV